MPSSCIIFISFSFVFLKFESHEQTNILQLVSRAYPNKNPSLTGIQTQNLPITRRPHYHLSYLAIYNKFFFKLIIELWTTLEVAYISFCCWLLKWTTSNEQVIKSFQASFLKWSSFGTLFDLLLWSLFWSTIHMNYYLYFKNKN